MKPMLTAASVNDWTWTRWMSETSPHWSQWPVLLFYHCSRRGFALRRLSPTSPQEPEAVCESVCDQHTQVVSLVGDRETLTVNQMINCDWLKAHWEHSVLLPNKAITEHVRRSAALSINLSDTANANISITLTPLHQAVLKWKQISIQTFIKSKLSDSHIQSLWFTVCSLQSWY